MAKSFLKTSIWVTIIMVLGYIFSFAKESIIAYYFGVSLEVDAYTIAITIPVTLFALVAVSIQSVVIPLYSEFYYKQGKSYADNYASNLITSVAILCIILIVVLEIFAEPITYLFAPGFSHEAHDLSTALLRITIPTVFFSAIEKVLVGVLNVHKKFVLPTFSVYFLNIGIILFVLFLHAHLGIMAACLGQVVGSFIQVFFLWVLARRVFDFRFIFEIKSNDMQITIKKTLPVMWSISVSELCAIINRIVGSFLFVGSLAALGYASKLNSVFLSLFTSAIATIIYPLFAESSAKGDLKQLNERFNMALSLYTLLLIPLMLVVIIYRTELIKIVFERGAFDSAAVNSTQVLLGIYSAGILFMAMRDLLTKMYYSLKDTVTPAKNATIGVILNILLNLTLPFFLGVNGLAIGTSLTAIVISLRLLHVITKKNESINLHSFLSNLSKILLASIVMCAVILFYRDMSFLQNIYLNSVVGILLGALAYLLSLVILKTPIIYSLHKQSCLK